MPRDSEDSTAAILFARSESISVGSMRFVGTKCVGTNRRDLSSDSSRTVPELPASKKW